MNGKVKAFEVQLSVCGFATGPAHYNSDDIAAMVAEKVQNMALRGDLDSDSVKLRYVVVFQGGYDDDAD